MSGYLDRTKSVTLVDQSPNQPPAAVVTGEPVAGVGGLVVYTSNGYADNPLRVDPTGTTVQPVAVVSGGGINSSVGPTGAAVPANATFVGALDTFGNLAGLKVDASGKLETTASLSASAVQLNDGVNGPVSVNPLLHSTALTTLLVDANGDQIVSFGGGTQYATGTLQVTPTGTVALGQDSGNHLRALSTDTSGTLNVNVVSGGGSPNVNLVTVSGSAITLGQKLMAASLPVVLASDHSDVNVHVQNFPAAQIVTQSVAANLNATVVFGAPQHVIVDSGAVTVSGSVTVSGTVTANAGTGTFNTLDGADGTVGNAVSATVIGVGFKDNTGKYAFANLDGSGNLKVVASGTTSTQYTDGAVSVTPTGTVAFGFDGTDVWALRLDGSKNLNVNLAANSFGTITVSGTVAISGTVQDVADGTVGGVSQPASAIQVGGWDGGHFRALATDSSGQPKVLVQNFPATQNVSVTNASLAVTQSTSPWVTQDTSDGAPNTLSQPGEATQVAGWDGTRLRVISTDSTGAVNITGSISATNPSVGVTGAAVPADATYIGALDNNGHLTGLELESASNPNLRVGIYQGANEVTVTSNRLLVDGSGVTQPVSGTVIANAGSGTFAVADANLELVQGSTTSGQLGPLVQGAVTTAAPTYTTAKTNPLSLTTAGALRVDGSGATQPVSGSVTVSGTVAATQSGTWTVQQGGAPWSVSVSGSVTVTGTVTANIGSTGGLALDATLTGGTVQVQTLPASPTTQKWSVADINQASLNGTATIIAGVLGKKVYVMSMWMAGSGAGNVTFQDSTPTAFMTNMPVTGNWSMARDNNQGDPIYVTASGKGFQIVTSAAMQIGGNIWYVQV